MSSSRSSPHSPLQTWSFPIMFRTSRPPLVIALPDRSVQAHAFEPLTSPANMARFKVKHAGRAPVRSKSGLSMLLVRAEDEEISTLRPSVVDLPAPPTPRPRRHRKYRARASHSTEPLPLDLVFSFSVPYTAFQPTVGHFPPPIPSSVFPVPAPSTGLKKAKRKKRKEMRVEGTGSLTAESKEEEERTTRTLPEEGLVAAGNCAAIHLSRAGCKHGRSS